MDNDIGIRRQGCTIINIQIGRHGKGYAEGIKGKAKQIVDQ